MARPTNANLELRKARKNDASLELNQALVVRLLGVLQAVAEGPTMAAEVAFIHPAALTSNPQPRLQAQVVMGQEGRLATIVPAPTTAIEAQLVIVANMASTLHPVIPRIAAEFDINVFRGPSSEVTDDWQRGALQTKELASDWQRPGREHVTCSTDWQEAAPLMTSVVEHSEIMPQCHVQKRVIFDEGRALGSAHGQWYDNLPPCHVANRSLWGEGTAVGSWKVSGYRHPPRGDKEWQVDQWQEGAALGFTLTGQRWQLGIPLHRSWLDGWDEAIWPLPGISPPPKPPIKPEKLEKRKLRLEFGRPRGDASLEFVWYGQDAQIVIPTRRVYLVSNTASIVRVRDGLDIPATAVSIELDTDSWAWQFNAQIPRIAAAALTDEEEVSIHINGQQWDCVCDGWQSSQSFGRESATLTGRSRTAYLSPTHVLPQAVSESSAATMAQLAAAVLPFGWTLEWQAADWLVPGGFFSLDGQTPIEVVKYLAEAAGGFVLPHQRSQHLVIKPRYPTVPWQFETALVDVAIPRAIITTLGSDFQPGQSANGIWVSGGHQGISARVLRQGTAGERQAPTITHPLVCDVVAARAQGVVGLARTMPKRTQSIELPLSNDTGLILPGALLAVDGWKGFNRGVRVSAALQNKAMTVRQQLSVERFV